MAMETRIRLTRIENLLERCHDGTAPLEEGPSYVRFVCALTVKYSTRRLGGGGLADAVPDDAGVRQFTVTKKSDVLPVVDPSVFLNYEETQRIAWRMITGLPGLDRYDLSHGNWRTSKPDDAVATWIHDLAQTNDDRGLCGGHYRVVVFIDVEVELVFSEPRALVRRCAWEETRTVEPCGICLDGLRTSRNSRTPPVKLPCGHAFHAPCITRWLFKGTTCPMCRDVLHAPRESVRYQRYAPTVEQLVQLGWKFMS
ncbi:hypothetical protein E2562_026695 [Oryza meyeriana var. granulata]|uniref:RING-type domain-containing protein n=1 Tax=Oryza meyeriana var. granulata TaxID=110450 RepID=A0A6G1E247_9ORYZ|nr:hypothetical protein E2562_026695 [Oryza meyeriana var. granulata]